MVKPTICNLRGRCADGNVKRWGYTASKLIILKAARAVGKNGKIILHSR